jgi:hypothetical protein
MGGIGPVTQESTMFTKSLIAVAALASVLSFASTAAKADPHISFGIGFGSGYGEPYPHYGYGDGFPGDYPPPPFYRPHRRPHFVDLPPPVRYGISCSEGRNVVREAGYEGVRAYRCGGSSYGYRAWRDGERYQVLVNRGGDIISERPLY